MIVIRKARPADLGAITEITNALLATTTYEWTSTPHTVSERLEWYAQKFEDGHPVFVAIDTEAPGATEEDQIVGWAAYGHFRDTAKWPGYRPVVEHTIHVREVSWGQGIGRQLMDVLADRARNSDKRAMIGAIDGENVDSIAFHLRLGFVEVGRLPGIGEKFDRPLDLVLVQLDL